MFYSGCWNYYVRESWTPNSTLFHARLVFKSILLRIRWIFPILWITFFLSPVLIGFLCAVAIFEEVPQRSWNKRRRVSEGGIFEFYVPKNLSWVNFCPNWAVWKVGTATVSLLIPLCLPLSLVSQGLRQGDATCVNYCAKIFDGKLAWNFLFEIFLQKWVVDRSRQWRLKCMIVEVILQLC